MPPKTNKQREKLEQSQASSRAKAHDALRGTAASGGFVGFSSFAKTSPENAPANPFAAFSTGAAYPGGGSGNGGSNEYGNVSASASAIYDGSDHEIAMALKMLGKKGPVTKIKALNGFLADILPHKKPVELRAMVGHFVQLYTFEIRDQKDRKVRHLLNEVLLALANKLKPKAFAPHLRRLLPYWLMAMHDVNQEAATAANKALEMLFPENKEMQAEIVVAHASAIMEEYSAFFQHTPDSFPGVTLVESDEREERYERCVTAAVLSVDKMINLFAATGNIAKLSDEDKAFTVAGVVSTDKFGRLVAVSSKNVNFTRDGIRKATYTTLKSLVTAAYSIVEVREEYFGKLILGAMSDKHPANQHALWDMVLTFLQQAAPTLWRQVDAQGFAKFVKSAVQPRLLAQVRHGFFGSARTSFPVLLPLLSMIPLEHVVDAQSGACALYSGVIENAWKFLVSADARFYEEDVIQSAFECVRAFMDYFLRSPTNRDAGARLLGMSAPGAEPQAPVVATYVNQFEKATKESLTELFTSTKLSVRHVKTYAHEWQTMQAKLSSVSNPISAPVATHFVRESTKWLVAVLEKLPSTAAVQPTRVSAFLQVVADGDATARVVVVTAGQRVYASCLEQLQHADRSTGALELMTGLYEVVGVEAMRLFEGNESIEHHYETHIRPLVQEAGALPLERLRSHSVSVALRAAKQFFSFVEHKKPFVLQLFQDFGVQYGDLAKAALVVDTCFQYPFTAAGATQWLASGSFHKQVSLDDEQPHALATMWKGKLLDEFVMISLKGRLDDVDTEAFASVLRACLGGDTYMPIVSADAVVILSHFVTQQQSEADAVMRLLPSLVALFGRLESDALPSELRAAEEQLYLSLFHLAAKSTFKTEAAALWRRAVRPAVATWTSTERRQSLINSLSQETNAFFASDGSSTGAVAFSPKIWAAYVELYLELALEKNPAADGNTDAAACTPFALINRLTIFDLRFEGSRSQLTTLYDRLLSSLSVLCDSEESSGATKRVADYFDELLERDRDRGVKLLRRLVDIDVCHGLTWAILQSESMASLSQESAAAPVEFVSLRVLYSHLAKHLPSVIAVLAAGEEASPRHRRVLFTNQHTEPGVHEDVDQVDDLSIDQHQRLDRLVASALVSLLTRVAATTYAEEWLHQQRGSAASLVAIGRLVRILGSAADDEPALAVLDRVLTKSSTVVAQWPSPMGAQALSVFASAWAMKETTAALPFDAAVHHPLLLKMSRAFAMSSQSSVAEWVDAAVFLTAVPSAWSADSETLDDTRKRWSIAARGLLTHALAGNASLAEVAAVGVQKRTLPASFDDSDDEERVVAGYPSKLVRSRRVVAELVHVMAQVDGGEPLNELAREHREALLATLLTGVAEGLIVKSRLVSTYLEVHSASKSLAVIELSAEIDALMDAAARTLPSLLHVVADAARVRAVLLESFVHVKGLAACFNLEKMSTPPHVRALLYAISTYTNVFQPSTGADPNAGVDINADDEAAAEAALAKSLIPAGLRAALKASFQSTTGAASGTTKRSRRRQQRPEEDDEVMARLLVWDLFIQLFPDSGSRDGGHLGMRSSALCTYVSKNGLLSSYLTLCGELLSKETGAQSSVARLKLQDEPLYQLESLDESVGETTIVSLAARSFFRTVLRLPAMVRTWWNDECSRSLRSWATKYFEEHITPFVLASELEIILKASQTHSWDEDEMTVKGSKVSREITTTYIKDECALEMVIRVPSSYPLRSVEVECTRRIGITEDRWRRWVLQIIKVTAAQDGSLLDAVLLWKKNLDKEFEGVEPCPICYSILNPKTMGLPSLSCKTCANKYHNSCLYKWFNQSGKNKCPICQQPFT